jgi:hypothetical protein
MMFYTSRSLPFASAVGLVAMLVASNRSEAQGVISPDGPNGFLRPYPVYREAVFHAHRLAIPRTYSYQYNFRYNQPYHFRVVGPDGKTFWRTTVRGLPMGMQWLAD